jgi:hypothetical protein
MRPAQGVVRGASPLAPPCRCARDRTADGLNSPARRARDSAKHSSTRPRILVLLCTKTGSSRRETGFSDSQPNQHACVTCQSNPFQRQSWGGASPPRWGGRSSARSTGRWGTRFTGRSSAPWGRRSTPRSTPLSSGRWGARFTTRSTPDSTPRSSGRSTPRWGGRSSGACRVSPGVEVSRTMSIACSRS